MSTDSLEFQEEKAKPITGQAVSVNMLKGCGKVAPRAQSRRSAVSAWPRRPVHGPRPKWPYHRESWLSRCL